MKHIVYIVGAGLTKALERSHPIPLMSDFVSVMGDYIWSNDGAYDKTILTTLADLEHSGIFEHSNAEGKELARRVLDFVNGKGELTLDDGRRFQNLMKTRPAENIERLLGRALEKGADEFGAGFIPQRFNFAINRVFARAGSDLNTVCLEDFLKAQLDAGDTKHTFIVFNYDLTLEQCVQKQKRASWDVKSGYGFNVERFISPEGAADHMQQFEGAGGAFRFLRSNQLKPRSGGPNPIKILKPHGSLNWLLGFQENYHFINATPVLFLNPDNSIAYYPGFACQEVQLKDEIGWDVSQESVWPNGALYLIPPAETKIRDLDVVKRIRTQEEEAYRTADEVYVIGWSMPSTDREQVEIIRQSFQRRNKPIQQLTVINCNAESTYYDRVAEMFEFDRRRLQIFDSGFCDYVGRRSRNRLWGKLLHFLLHGRFSSFPGRL